jgi:adenylosuccinate synthase
LYEEFPGWREEISHVRKNGDLPGNARRYLERLAELTGVPIALIGVGPGREEIMVNNPIF